MKAEKNESPLLRKVGRHSFFIYHIFAVIRGIDLEMPLSSYKQTKNDKIIKYDCKSRLLAIEC